MVNLKEAVTQKLEPVNTFLDHNPEREYLTGAALWIVYTLALVSPDLLPSEVVQALEFFRHLDPSSYEPILIGSAATGAALTVDGARRIAFNRLPFVKAYLFYLKEDLKNKLSK